MSLRLSSLTAYVLLALAVLIAVLPVLWIALTSLKPESQTLVYPPVLLPRAISLDAYRQVLSRETFLRNLLNSGLYAGGAALFTLLVAIPGGYAAARMQFRGKELLLLTILASSMIPGVALLVPLFYVFDRAHLIDSFIAVMLVYASTCVPQSLWFTRAFIETVPEAIEEAALIDGCSRLQALARVTLPLVAPGLGALLVFSFISVWNDYVYIAALTRDQALQTVQVALVNQVFESLGISWSVLSAFITIGALPILALFVWVQRWFVMGLVAGGVKG